jgi:hypothetical protein
MKRWLVLFLSLILATLALLQVGCGNSENSTSQDNVSDQGSSGGAVGQAESAACAANRRTIASAVQQYKAIEGKSPTSIQQLVPKYLQKVPTCPSGGTYSLSGGTVTCSVHGS